MYLTLSYITSLMALDNKLQKTVNSKIQKTGDVFINASVRNTNVAPKKLK